MFINNYSLRVPEGIDHGDGYILLKNETEYSIILRNQHNTTSKIEASIDGKYIGTWYIKPRSNITIDHPINSDNKLVFLKKKDSEGLLDNISNDDLGLLSVMFTPLKENSKWNTEFWAIYTTCGCGHDCHHSCCKCPKPYYPYLNVNEIPFSYTVNTTNKIFTLLDKSSTCTGVEMPLITNLSSSVNVFVSGNDQPGGTVFNNSTDHKFQQSEMAQPDEAEYDFRNQTLIMVRLIANDNVDNKKYDKLTPAYSTSRPKPIR